MTGQRLNWSIALLIIAIWELFFYLGFIDPTHVSHPLDIARVLTTPQFVQGFGVVAAQGASAFIFGGAIALGLRILILRSTWLTSSAIRWLRNAIWVPFIVYWALPIWSPRELTFVQAFSLAFIAICAVITLASLYYFLLAQTVPALKSQTGSRLAVKCVIDRALLITLIAQIWMVPHGWPWYFFPRQPIAGLYAVFLLLVLLSFLTNRLLQVHFDESAAMRGTVLIEELENRNSSMLGPVIITLVLLPIWQLLGSAGLLSVISSPFRVAKTAWRFLIFSAVIPNDYSNDIWRHLLLSIWEILVGIAVAGGLGVLVHRIVSTSETARKWLFPILPFTNIVPIVFAVLFSIWSGILGAGQTAATVALLTFFPFLQVLWGLPDRRLLCRILLAIDAALPFGFVAMLFGEAMSSVAGLGFLMAFTHTDERLTDKGLAIATLTVALLIILSGILRLLAWRADPASE